MALAEIKEAVDHISETWRDGSAGERRSELALLDDALAELDDIDADTQLLVEAVEELRGRIEVLMDEIEISLGLEPTPLNVPVEADPIFDDAELAEFEGGQEVAGRPGAPQ